MSTNDSSSANAPQVRPRSGTRNDDPQAERDGEALPWLSDQRVAVPGRVTGYLERAALIQRCMPTGRRITLLKAPGGFGKSTLMAECCRELARQGVPAAWLSLGPPHDPELLSLYMMEAFRHAGLMLVDPPRSNGTGYRNSRERFDALFRAIDAHDGPWVLALDELEVLAGESISLVNTLVQTAPSALHFLLACRALPVGLDVAARYFEGAAKLLTEEDLRFSRPDVEGYFDGKLSRRELSAVVAESRGWPIALRIYDNARPRGPRQRDLREVVDNWIESRFWYDLGDNDRQLLYDVGLFDWFDEELLEEALGTPDLLRRLKSMTGLAGLLESVRGSGGRIWRLHALIREACAARSRRESPERYRRINRRIALALARRGETAEAMRHAFEAADAALVGRFLTDAGGVRLWLRKGADVLSTANRYLSDEVIELFPRLGLVRAVSQAISGNAQEANQWVDATVRSLSPPNPSTDVDTEVELLFTRGILALLGTDSIVSDAVEAVAAQCRVMLEAPGFDPVTRGTMEAGLCMIHSLKGELNAALEHGERARRWLGDRCPYLTLLLDAQFGHMAMAQGWIDEAARLYGQIERSAASRTLDDRRLKLVARVLTNELDLERNRPGEFDRCIRDTREFLAFGAQLPFQMAASTVAVDLTLKTLGTDSALFVIDEMCEHAMSSKRPAVARYLTGLRIAILSLDGRVDEAERRWRADALPDSDAGCLDLRRQSWREMEVLACARLRLLAGRGQIDRGRDLLRNLVALSEQRNLRRTWMRALVSGMVLEEAAGERRAAAMHLRAFLELFAETDYAWPVVRESAIVKPVLSAALADLSKTSLLSPANALLGQFEADAASDVPVLSERETEVLSRLETQTDRQIAADLGLTPEGVRYHVRKLFNTLNVGSRIEGVHRARSLGLLPPGSR